MKLLLISNSTNYKEPYLGWCQPLIKEFLRGTKKNIAFVPYAGVDVAGKVYPASYDAYTERVQKVFDAFGKKIISVHSAKDPAKVIEKADIIMVGGGNTFHLVAELHRNKLPILRRSTTPSVTAARRAKCASTSIWPSTRSAPSPACAKAPPSGWTTSASPSAAPAI